MNFRYAGRDAKGNPIEGTIEADSADAARDELRRDGVTAAEIEEADDAPLFPGRVSKHELIYVTNQLSIMVDTGVTLSTALKGILEQEANPKLRQVLRELHAAVESGEDFSTALSRHPKVFDRTYCSLVKASEATGTLSEMLERIACYLRKEVETASKVRAAMAYPAVMMVVAVGVTIFLLTFILPKFLPLFESKKMELPKVTKLMMTLSSAMTGHWVLWAVGAAAAVGGFLYWRKTDSGRQSLDYLKIHAPILGPMFRKVILSRSIRTLGTMLRSGVPIMDAINLSGEVAGNVFYERTWRRVHDEVAEGRRICEVLRADALFPRVLTQMISAGEESGKLDDVLERVSNYYDSEVETSVKAATSLIEPILISAMGVVVGTIGLSLLLPIFSLSRQH